MKSVLKKRFANPPLPMIAVVLMMMIVMALWAVPGKTSAASLPSKMDLRDVNGKSYVTPVRLQNPYGTCWGFGAIAAAESSLLSSGLAQKEGYTSETLDLSEKHLAFFTFNHINDPSNPQNGEGMHYPKGTTVSQRYDSGGVTLYATSLFSSGIGPNEERDTKGEYIDDMAYRGKKGIVTQTKVNGKLKNIWYSEDDDWSIDNDLRFYQTFRLKESRRLTSPARVSGTRYKFDPEGLEQIKNEIASEHRAVAVSFHAESFLPGQTAVNKKYMSENWAHYTFEPKQSNHVVCIVGYDDNYKKTNFLKGHQPPSDGAFLCKNSWGSDFNDFPNSGERHWGLPDKKDSSKHTGYFWISYYDKSLDEPESFIFEKANDKEYELEQHDLMPVNTPASVEATSTAKMANAFSAEVKGDLSAVSCQTEQPDTTVTYDVYLLKKQYTRPTQGVKVYSKKVKYKYAGYHRQILDEKDMIRLQKNQKYSVVVTQKTKGGNYLVNCQMGINKRAAKKLNVKGWLNAVVNKGESYIYESKKWSDLSRKSVKNMLLQDDAPLAVIDNFPIKAYIEPNDDPVSLDAGKDIVIDKGSGETTANAVLRFFGGGKDTEGEDVPQIEWKSSNPKIFTVTKDSKDDTMAVVKGKAYGSAYLVVSAGKYGKQVVGVTVRGGEGPFERGAPRDETEDYLFASMRKTDYPNAEILPMLLKSTKQTKKSLKVGWKGLKKSRKAAKYVLYGSKKGACMDMIASFKSAKKAYNVKEISGDGLKAKTYYKFVVVAYDKNDTFVAVSGIIHAATKGGKAANYKKITVKANAGKKGKKTKKFKKIKKLTVKKNKTYRIKVKGIAPKKKKVKKILKFRYVSSNENILTIDAKGSIKGQKKGKCKIYVYAQNGLCRIIKVRVK